jgi:hypothetical protein
VVELQAGATWRGAFILPAKPGSGWVVIRSSRAGSLPAGRRVTPDDAPSLARLEGGADDEPVLGTARGASGYRLVGLEISAAPSGLPSLLNSIVTLGAPAQGVDQMPRNLVLDRVWVHGTPRQGVRRCVTMNSAYTAIVDSYLDDCHAKGTDAQAILSYDGTGPFLIQNDFLAGSGETVMFGGADPKIPGLVPSDIVIRGNHFYRPPSWQGVWSVKNHLESKNSQRVLVEDNVFENNWKDAQTGFAVVLKSTDQSGGGNCNWCVTQDWTVRNNAILQTTAGLNLAAAQPTSTVPMAKRMRFENNLVETTSKWGCGACGKVLQVSSGMDDLAFVHNTWIGSHSFLILYPSVYGPPRAQRFVYDGNLASHGEYGAPAGKFGSGGAALQALYPATWEMKDNVFFGGKRFAAALYPSSNRYVSDAGRLGFAGFATGDYSLAASSTYRGVGVDWSRLRPAMNRAVAGR